METCPACGGQFKDLDLHLSTPAGADCLREIEMYDLEVQE